jgi:hypothetical protein
VSMRKGFDGLAAEAAKSLPPRKRG